MNMVPFSLFQLAYETQNSSAVAEMTQILNVENICEERYSQACGDCALQSFL